MFVGSSGPLRQAPDPAIPGNCIEFRPASNGTSVRPENQQVQYGYVKTLFVCLFYDQGQSSSLDNKKNAGLMFKRAWNQPSAASGAKCYQIGP